MNMSKLFRVLRKKRLVNLEIQNKLFRNMRNRKKLINIK